VVIMARLETENFDFYAFGSNKKECLELLKQRWEQHRNQTGAYWKFSELQDSIWFGKVQNGAWERSELPNPKTKNEGN
jgi:hypothetical protein